MAVREFRTRTLILGLTLGFVTLALITTVVVLRQVLVAEAGVLTEGSLRTEGQTLIEYIAAEKPTPDQSSQQFAAETLQRYYDANVSDLNETLIVVQGIEVLAQVGPELSGLSPLLAEIDASGLADSAEPVLLDGRADQGQLRMLVRAIDGDTIENSQLIVAISTEEQQDFIYRAFRDAIFVAAGTLALAFPLAWFVAGRVLRPIELLAKTAKEITEHDLSQRLPAQGTTEVAHMIDSFNAMVDRLESLVREQRQFLNDASHELRTPLTIMRGHLEMANQNHEKASDANAIAMVELDRMGRIVDDLLVLARAKQVDFLRIAPVDSDDFLTSILQRVTAMSDQRWVVDALPLGIFHADAQRLDQVMLNLCINASRHTPPSGEIGIGAELASDHFRMWVRDTGEGISSEDQQRIFERFQRGTTQRTAGGSAGLGLPIAQAIVEAHGGTVNVESQLGNGSRFTVVVPIKQPSQTK